MPLRGLNQIKNLENFNGLRQSQICNRLYKCLGTQRGQLTFFFLPSRYCMLRVTKWMNKKESLKIKVFSKEMLHFYTAG